LTQFKQMTRTRPSPMFSITQRGMGQYEVALSVCGKSGGIGSYKGRFKSFVGKKVKIHCDSTVVESTVTHDLPYELLKENWSNFVVGTYVTNTNKGFLKVFYDGEIIYDYRGPTYGWTKVVESYVRIGIYRDGHEFGGEYPPQTIHFDDFVIGSSKDDVTEILWSD
jgi:hypothetical protein